MTIVNECANNGIYILYLNEKMRYIGKSKNVFQRFIKHKGEFEFDKALIFPCPDTSDEFDDYNLRCIEEKLIFLYSPPENTQKNKGSNLEKKFNEKLRSIIDYYEPEYKEAGKLIPMPKGNETKDIVEWVIELECEVQRMLNEWREMGCGEALC